MTQQEVYNYLLLVLKEKQLAYTILFMAQPMISYDIKNDLSTFTFTWNKIQKILMNLLNISTNMDMFHSIYDSIPSIHVVNYFTSTIQLIRIESKLKMNHNEMYDSSSIRQFINYLKKYVLYFNQVQRLKLMNKLGILHINNI
uniref:Uncharacterized protein n=1 Tax=viral metagenome TaxID=1070528 RepID=A0A6C0KM94_9ZZZZ